MPRPDRSPRPLAALLAPAGAARLASPRPFGSLVPKLLPGSPRTWTCAGGAVEPAPAAGLTLPRTRTPAARATAAVFAGVLPARVQMAVDRRRRPALRRNAALARPPLQVALVMWARGIARGGKEAR